MTGKPTSVHPSNASSTQFAVVFDIRPHAASTPTLNDAIAVPADLLTSDPARFIKDASDSVLVVCDIGVRSEVISAQLRIAGYTHAISLEGGIAAWIEAGLPTRAPVGLSPDEYSRYDRQLKLPDFGIPAQQAIGDARVAIVGVGGLGVPVLSYLTGAGVGHITIIDSDRIEVSNLHRQPIYSVSDVAAPKAPVAAAYASALNPMIEVQPITERIDDANARTIVSGHDVVVTCTDSFETAHTINAAAVELGIPMVFGSVYRTEGQLAVFDAVKGPCYACVFPEESGATGLDCAIVGVLGSVTGVIGSMQATEVLKLVVGSEFVDTGSLRLYDAQTQSIDALTLRRRPSCNVCS